MVHQILSTPGGGDAPPDTDEQFLALLCAEEDLLRAEFDAIIAAEWPAPAPPRTTVGANVEDGDPRNQDQYGARAAHRWVRRYRCGIRRWARQRSPPRPNTTPTAETEVTPPDEPLYARTAPE